MAVFPTVPETVTVHLAAPDTAADNITVTFPDYIKNVASSEIYPTWPDAAIRANIYAQISFALNRIYTEYYPSRGYAFDITADTSIDQSFVRGRDIFENISAIVDELFNHYLRRQGSIEPLFAQYCNGTTTICEGMSQWGTVPLAEEGLTPIEILRSFYGEDIEIVRDAPVDGITASLPSASLRLSSSGNDVLSVQIRLNRISNNYPAIPKINDPQGFFDRPTQDAVLAFQEIFDLAADGIVGKSTWYRIQYIYNSVKRLNELDSEGLRAEELANRFPGLLAEGDSGIYVKDVQYLLELVGQYEDSVPPVSADGIFGSGTAAAVRSFQRTYGLNETGEIDEETYRVLYEVYTGILLSLPADLFQNEAAPYPGAPLVLGSQSDAVRNLQTYLNRIAASYPSLGTLEVTGIYDPATEAAVSEFQRLNGLPVTGTVPAVTWNTIADTYDDLRSGDYLGQGQYPGFVPEEGTDA